MSNFLSQLTARARARLLEELDYINLEEIRGFCSERGIAYRIRAESADGKVKATEDTDRKPIVLARIRRYLTTGQVGLPHGPAALADGSGRTTNRPRLVYGVRDGAS
jgi:hypothetical protein